MNPDLLLALLKGVCVFSGQADSMIGWLCEVSVFALPSFILIHPLGPVWIHRKKNIMEFILCSLYAKKYYGVYIM